MVSHVQVGIWHILSILCVCFISENLDKEKERLANYMAYGEDLPPITAQRKEEILRVKTPPPEIDRFDECK